MVRAAIVGVGFVGAQHLEALRRLGDVEVVAVAASSAERARDAARLHHVPRSSGDYRELLADPGIDVVHVCAPNDLHFPIAADAIRAGKHVVCEKPLAVDSRQGAELVALAEGSDRVSVVCHNYRFFPMVAELRARVLAGDIGRPHLVRGSYLQDWLLLPTDYNWRVDPGRGGASRTIADIGTHWVDLAETVTGRSLVSVMADVSTVHTRRQAQEARTFEQADGAHAPPDDTGWQEIRTEDQANLLLRFEGELAGSLTVSQVAAGHKNDLTLSVDGSEASATWRQERPDELWIGRREEGSMVVPRSPTSGSESARRLARLPGGHNEGWADGLRNLFASVYAVIRGDSAPADLPVPLPTFRDGLGHLLFVEAALESSRRRGWVRVDDAATPVAGPAGTEAGA